MAQGQEEKYGSLKNKRLFGKQQREKKAHIIEFSFFWNVMEEKRTTKGHNTVSLSFFSK